MDGGVTYLPGVSHIRRVRLLHLNVPEHCLFTLSLSSDDISKISLHPFEKNDATNQKQHHHPCAQRHDAECRSFRGKQCPAESLDDSRHWIEPVEETPLLWNDAQRVSHGRSEHPKLN